jgi:hypothetical protein
VDLLEEMIRKEDKKMLARDRKIALENKLRIERSKKEGLHRGKRIKKDSVLDILNPRITRADRKRKVYTKYI